MKDFRTTLRNALLGALALLAFLLPSEGALAQAVVQMPQFVAPRTVLDLGNGPLEVMPLVGNAGIFTSQGSGLGSGTTTTVTLTATPTIPPCIGCAISGGTLVASSIVTAFNGTTTITTNTSQTIGASTPLAWGAACPVSTQAAPVQPPTSASMAFLQAGVNDVLAGVPFYTLARLCAYGATGPGMQFVSFPQGAH